MVGNENIKPTSLTIIALDATPEGPNILEATHEDVVIRYVLMQPCLCEAHQTAPPILPLTPGESS